MPTQIQIKRLDYPNDEEPTKHQHCQWLGDNREVCYAVAEWSLKSDGDPFDLAVCGPHQGDALSGFAG